MPAIGGGSLGQLHWDLGIKTPGLNPQLVAVTQALKQLNLTAKSLNATLRQTARQKKKLRDEGKKTETVFDKMGKTWKKLQARFRQFLVVVGTLIVLRRFVRVMTEFETAMAEVSTIAGESAAKMKLLTDGVLRLAKVMPQSASDLGAGLYQVISAGVTSTADAMLVLEASARAATAGLTDTKVAVDAVTTVLNAYQKEASEAANVTDVLFKTVELGKITFPELAQNIGNVATSAALAGVSIEEVSAGIATMTKFGIKAAEATTSLNRLFLTLTSKSKEQAAAFERMGIEFNVATVRTKGFAGLLQELNKLTDEQIDQLAELFPNIRAARAAFVLAGKGTGEYLRILSQTEQAQGAATRAAQKMNETLRNQAAILVGNLSVIMNQIGRVVLPMLAKAISHVNDLFLSSLEKQIRSYERLGLTVRLTELQRRQMIEANIEVMDEFKRKAEEAYRKAILDAKLFFQAAQTVSRADLFGTPPLPFTREAARQAQMVNAEMEKLRENRELYERALKGEIPIQDEIIRLQRQAAELADEEAQRGIEGEKLFEGRRINIEKELEVLRDVAAWRADIYRLELENARLRDRQFQAQQSELRRQRELLGLMQKTGAEASAIARVQERITFLEAQVSIRETKDDLEAMRPLVKEVYDDFLAPADSLEEQKALVDGIGEEVERLRVKQQDMLASTDEMTNKRREEIDLIGEQIPRLLQVQAFQQLILDILTAIEAARKGENEELEKTLKLTGDQLAFLRKLRAAVAEEMGDLDLLQVMKFDEMVRGFAEAFDFEIAQEFEQGEGVAKTIGANYAGAIVKGATEALGREGAQEVLKFFQFLWEEQVLKFDPTESLAKRIQSSIAALRVDTFGDKITAPIEKVRKEWEELKKSVKDDAEIQNIERLLREWGRAAEEAAANKVLEDLNRQLREFTSTAATGALDDFIKKTTELEDAVAELPEGYEEAKAALEEWLRSNIALEEHRKQLEDIAGALSLRELEIEAAGMGEDEARQARLEAHEQALNELAAERMRIAFDLSLNEEQRTEAAEEAYQQYLQTLIAIQQIKGERTDTLKIEKDLLTVLRRQLRNMQAMVGLINQAFEGMISLLKATGAVSDEFADGANGVRQMVTGLATFSKHLDVLGQTQDHIAGLEDTIAGLRSEIDQGVDSTKELNEALKQLESAKGLKVEALGGVLAGGLGVAGGIASFAGAIAGMFGESPEAAARRKLIERNTKALQELTRNVHDLIGTFDVTGNELARAIMAMQREFGAGFTGQDLLEVLRWMFPTGITGPELDALLKGWGSSLKDFEAIADAMGVELYDGNRILVDNVLLVADHLGLLADSLIGFPDTLQGAMAEARVTTALYDLDDPILQAAAQLAGLAGAGAEFTAWLERMAAEGRNAVDALDEWQQGLYAFLQVFGDDILKIPGLKDLFALDLTTAEGRAQAEQIIREIFRQFQLGELDIEALGFATPQEFLDFITGFEGLLDQMEDAEIGGVTQDVRRQVSITELQANQLLAYQSTQTEIQRRMEGILIQIADSLGMGTTFTPVEVPPMPITSDELANWPEFQRMIDAFESAEFGGVDVSLNIDQVILESGATEDQAVEFANTALDEVRRQLGEAYKRNRRSKGLIE